MKRWLVTLSVVMVMGVLGALHAASSIIISIDGTFSDNAKGLIQGNKKVTFTLNSNANLAAKDEGIQLWKEVIPSVYFSDGYMSVDLGVITPLKREFFNNPNLSFLVEIDGVTGKVGLPARYTPLAIQSHVSDQALMVSANNIVGSFSSDKFVGNFPLITGVGTLTSLNVANDVTIRNNSLVVKGAQNRVGIGTANPQYPLDVNGSLRLSSGLLIFPDGTTMNTSAKSINASTILKQQNNVDIQAIAGNINMRTGQTLTNPNGTDRLTILNNGNVGIGVVSPVQLLDVNGALRVGNSTNSVLGSIRFNGTNFQGYNGSSWVALDVQSTSGGGWNNDSIPGFIYPSNTQGTKVGIGTTAPSTALEVVGTVSANVFSGSFTGNGSNLTQLNPANLSSSIPVNKGGTGVTALSQTSLVFADSANNRLGFYRVLQPGEILIGDGVGTPSISTLSAGSGVTINVGAGWIRVGHAATSTQNTITQNSTAVIQSIYLDKFGHVTKLATANMTSYFFTKSLTESRYLNVTGDAMTGPITFSAVSPALQTVTQNQSIVFMPHGTGKVGIGTLTPLQKLDIAGAIRIGDTTTSNAGAIRFNSGLSRFEGYNGTGWVYLDVQNNVAGGWRLNSNSVTLDIPTFNVGVGAANPTEKLQVSGNIWVGNDLRVSGNARLSQSILFKNNSISNKNLTGNWSFSNGNLANVNNLSVTTLGVGISTPNIAFHTSGSGQFNGQLNVSSNVYIGGNSTVFGQTTLGAGLTGTSATFNGTLKANSLILGSNTLSSGNMTGAWNFNNNALTGVSLLKLPGLTLQNNTLQSTATLNLLPSTNYGLVLGSHFQVKNGVISGLLNQNTTLNAYAGQSVVIEKVSFKNGAISGITSLGLSGGIAGGSLSLGGGLIVSTNALVVATVSHNVGIGTASPSPNARLHVLGDVVIGPGTIVHNATPKSDLFVEGNLILDGQLIQHTSTNNTFLDMNVLGKTRLATASGNVGIGTTTAQSLVEILASNNASTSRAFRIQNAALTPLWVVFNDGKTGIGTSAPESWLHLAAGTNSKASFIMESGTLLTTPRSGALEYDGARLYFTSSQNIRQTLVQTSTSQNLSQKTLINPVLLGTTRVSGNMLTSGALTLGDGTQPISILGNNFTVDSLGAATMNRLSVGKLTLATSNITTHPGYSLYLNSNGVATGVVLNNQLQFSNNVFTGLVNQPTTWNAYVNQPLILENVHLKDGNISQVVDLTMTGGLTVNTSTLYTSSTLGNVGIGTATPTSSVKLQVLGGDLALGPNSVIKRGSGSSDLFVQGNGIFGGAVVGLGTGNELNDLWVSQNVVLNAVSGKVGIGTTTPVAQLDLRSRSTAAPVFKAVSNAGLPLFSILDSGKVGINVATPSVALEVIGTVNATRYIGDGSLLTGIDSFWTPVGNNIHYTSGNVGIGETTPLAWLHLGDGSTTRASLIIKPGTLLTTPVPGAIEFDGTKLYYTITGPIRKSVVNLDDAQALTNKTITGGFIGNNSVSGTWATSANLTLGDGGDQIIINASNWSVNSAGTGTFGRINVDSLQLDLNTISSTSSIQLSPQTGSSLFLGSHFGILANTLSGQSNLDSIVKPFSGRSILMDGMAFRNNSILSGGSITITGNLTVDSPSLVVSATNHNVGIGTASPGASSKLTVAGGDLWVGSGSAHDGTGGEDLFVFSGNLIADNNSFLGLNSGSVGVATTTPGAKLGIKTPSLSTDTAIKVIDATDTPSWVVLGNGQTGIGNTTPGALLHLGAGSNTVPALRFTTGNLLSTPASGAIEFNGSDLFYTAGATRLTVANTSAAQTFTNKTLLNGAIGSNSVSGNWTATGPLSIGSTAQNLTLLASNWRVASNGTATFNSQINVGNMRLAGNTFSSLSGGLNLTPAAGSGVLLDNFINFDGGLITSSGGSNTTWNASAGKSLVLEQVGLKAGAVTGVTTLSMSSDLTTSGDIAVNGGDIRSTQKLRLTPAAGASVNINLTGTGRFSVNTQNFYVDPSVTRVGIGTSTPRVTLDVIGTVSANYFAGDGGGLYNVETTWTTTSDLRIWYTGNNVGVGVSLPRAWLEVGAGSSSRAGLIVGTGPVLSSPLAGAIEMDGTSMFFTNNSNQRKTLVTLDQSQTLTNKTLTTPDLQGASVSGTFATTASGVTLGSNNSAIVVDSNNWDVNSSGQATFQSLTISNTSLTNGNLSLSSGTMNISAANDVVIDSNFVFDGTARQLKINGGNASIFANSGQLTLESVVFNGGAMSGVTTLGMSGNLTSGGGITAAGNLVLGGSAVITGNLAVNGGTFSSNTNLTVQPNTNRNVTFSLGGSGAMDINIGATGYLAVGTTKLYVDSATGRVGIGTNTPASPYLLDVQGNVRSTGSYYGDGSQLTGIDSKWKDDPATNTRNIYYDKGRVGIGVSDPLSDGDYLASPVGALTIASHNGTIMIGKFGSGVIPIEGYSEPRFMWYPRKSALRAGRLQTNANLWDNTSIGNDSVAFGNSNIAGGLGSGALSGKDNNATTNYATIAGGQQNTASQTYAFVGGGRLNRATGINATAVGGLQNQSINDYSTIAGGQQNTASGFETTVVGGEFNKALGAYSFIGGGGNNTTLTNASYGVIGGGDSNKVSQVYGNVGGGNANSATRQYATISGGRNNIAGGDFSVVGGGDANKVTGNYSAIFSGLNNQVNGGGASLTNQRFSVIVGGESNSITSTSVHNHSFIGAGSTNTITDVESGFIGGGASNYLNANVSYSSVVGGLSNGISSGSQYSFIGGGNANTISNSTTYGVIGGGNANVLNSTSLATVIAGGDSNSVASNISYSSIGGGKSNVMNGNYATLAGGRSLTIISDYGSILGGQGNAVGGLNAVVGGGLYNTVTGNYSGVFSGESNHIESSVPGNSVHSFIGGGLSNTITDSGVSNGSKSVINGGESNSITQANHGAILGGQSNTITQANHASILGGQSNSIAVNADRSVIAGGQSNSVLSGANNSFVAGTQGRSNAVGAFVYSDYQSTSNTFTATRNNSFMVRARGGVYFYTNGQLLSGSYIPAGGSGFTNVSDRNKKANFSSVDVDDVLKKVAALPIQTWNYKTQSPSIRHMGPMAQDFNEAFKLGEDPKGINTIDIDGVSLAAIQGLYKQVQEKDKKIKELEKRLEKIEALLEKQGKL